MKKPTLKQRFSYWFDNKMSGGSLGLIKLLAIVSLVIIVVIAAAIFIFSAAEERDIGSAFWDSMATVINAWMPSFEDGGPAYLILMAIAAIVGLFITSVLIGIIASAIEEKITSLRRGNSAVLEEGHTVVLGFYPGEYSLLRQLILASADDPVCIVVAEDMQRDEMEQYIADNVEIPKNVRVICRTIDIQDPRMLEKLAISECRSVIISPTDDRRTTKALLAVSSLISRDVNSNVRVGAIMSREEYVFPQSLARQHNVTTLQTYDVIAKMIAHSCTEPGLSETFREVFNFEGSELYLVDIPGAAGLNFSELSVRTEAAVPVGIGNESGIMMNPGADYVIKETDRILVFSEENDSVKLLAENQVPETSGKLPVITDDISEHPGRIVIFGCNETIGTILHELPEGTKEILIAGNSESFRSLIDEELKERPELEISFDTSDLMKEQNLLRIARDAEHIVILSDHEQEAEDADIHSIFLLLHLRDLRERYRFTYNITAEMRLENNQALIENDDKTDFVVASNMSSLILAQLAESPELFGAFRELLSNKGNELYLKEAEAFGCTGTHGVAELRQAALQCGYLFLGYLKKETGESTFNPPLTEKIALTEEDCVIVIGES